MTIDGPRPPAPHAWNVLLSAFLLGDIRTICLFLFDLLKNLLLCVVLLLLFCRQEPSFPSFRDILPHEKEPP